MSTRSLTAEPARAQPIRTPTESPLARGGVTEMEWEAEASAQAPCPELHLAGLEVHGQRTLVFDDDTARGLVTHWLLRELAPMLGLDPSTIEVHVDSEAASRNDARHTTGLIENGAIYIHPRGFDPATKAGRSLLAHETAHAAQRQLSAPGVQHTERAHAAAEQEAAAIAHAFAERATVMQPRSSLPALVTAAAEDATTTASATNTPPPVELAVSVPISRAREIAEIHRILSGLWISDGDVFGVMRILDTMAFKVAKTVVSLLGDNAYHLADNINAPHLGPHTASVVATYAALADISQAHLQKAIDLDVFGEGSWGEMTSEVKGAARDVIAQLRPDQRQELLKSENRLDIKRLTSAADVFPEETKEREKADEEVRKKEADLAAARDAIAKLDDKNNNDAKDLLQKVEDTLHPPAVDEGEPPTPQRSLDAVQLLVPFNGTPMLSFIAEKLDGKGLVDTIVQTLPDDYFAEGKTETETVLELVQARLPSKNVDLVVDLLSYSLFDWAIRDYEAVFAYRILLSLPLSAQYSFRQREGGKYFFRLTQNLPKDKGYREIEVHKASKEELKKLSGQLKSGQKSIVDEEAGLYDAARLYADKRADAHTAATIKTLMDQAEAAQKKGWKQKDAAELFYALAAVGGATGAGAGAAMTFNAKDQLLTETAVHDLDSAGYIEQLFKALSNDFLFSEDTRIATVKIMMARDPIRAAAHARDLVSYGIFDWMVTDREAYLAYLCVKALPEDERATLLKNDAWAWKRIQSEMSQEMRQSRDLNIYVGDKEGTDRASVLGRLAEKATWTEENAATLDGLLRMAIAMSEHKFVFERSKEFKAYAEDKPTLNALVKKYKLAKDKDQTWQPDILKGTKWYEEGLFDTLRTLWKGLVFLWDNDLLLVTRSVGGLDLDLNEAQDVMGGNLLGAHLADPKKTKGPGQEPSPDANKLTLLADVGAHAVTVLLPDLILDSVNFQSPEGTIEAGSLRLRDLKIYATYDSESMTQPTSAQINVGSFEMGDLLLAMREKMVTVSRFLLTTLHLGAGTKDTTTRSKAVPRNGYYFPFPFLTTIGTAVYYLFKFKGWGTDTPAQEMKHGMEQVRALDLTFANLELQGLTTSGGQTIGNLKVADFALRIGMNKTTVLRAQIASLDNQKRRKQAQKNDAGVKEIEARQVKLQLQLSDLEADEKWVIVAQQRIIHDKLQPDESKKLQDKIDKLKFEAQGGQFLDIGSIDASGIDGGVTVKSPIHLEGLHGEGKTNDMAGGLGLGVVTDAQLIDQMAQGSHGAPAALSEHGGEFRLAIDKFHADGVSVGGGTIRGVGDIEARMKELDKDKDKPEFAALYEELQNDLLPKARRYEEYIQIGVSALDDDQLKDFQELRVTLAKDPSMVFDSIDLVRAHLDVDLTTGGVGLGADQAVLKNIVMPEKGLSFKELRGADIQANAAVGNGLAGWLDWKKNLTGGGVHAGLLELSHASDRNSGLLFEHAALKGGGVDVKRRGDEATAKFDTLTVEGLGVKPRLELMRRRSAALEQSHSPSARERKERDRLRKDIPALEALVDKRVLAVAVVDKAKTTEERGTAARRLADLDGLIAAALADYGSARLQLDDFGIKATGAGDVLSDVLGGGFDQDKVLKRGVTLEGTGKDHQVLGHASLSYRSPAPDDARLGKTDVNAGPVKLNARVKEDDKNNVTVDIAQLELDSIALSEMMLSGLDKAEGGAKIWSSGRSTFDGIKFAGNLVFAPVANTEGDYRLAHIGITRFDIKSIEARGFGYANSEQKIDVRANTATVHGVNAEKMTIDLPADKNADAVIVGKTRLQSISNADLAATLPGGMELTHGLLNAQSLGIEFIEGGGKKLSIGDLSLMAAEFRSGPDNWARFSLEHLSGNITMDKHGYKLQKVKLQKLTVPSLDWRAGETGRITADQPVELAGLSVDGHIDMKEVDAPAKKGETAKVGATPKKDSKLVGIHIESFGIDSITAKHLTYKDGDTTIDIGPPTVEDPDVPKFMKTFRPFYIEHFQIDGLDWTSETGLEKGEINVEKYGAAVIYRDMAAHLKAGGGLTGSKMHASFTGPNTGTATLGKIDKAAGFLKNQDISTKFATMNIMESFTFGDNFVEMNNLAVDNVHIGNTTYGAGTDRVLGLRNAYVDKVTVDKVHIDYAKTSKDGEDKTELKGVGVGEVRLTNIRAEGLEYKGKSTETVDGKPVEKTQTLAGQSAHIDSLRFVDITYSPDEALTKFGIHVEEAPGKTPYAGRKPEAFGISGITGELVSKFSDGTETVANLAARLSGGPIDGDNITLQTVKLGEDENKNPITRTAVAGSFNLTRLGLESISATYKDRNGVTTTVSGIDKHGASVEITNIAPQFNANGTMVIPDMSAQAANFLVKRGNLTAVIPLLDIKNIALGMSGFGTAKGIEKFRAGIGSISVSERMRIVLAMHKTQTTQVDVDKAKTAPAGDKLFVDPLGGMDGNIVLHTGYGPETVPIRNGKIDFDNATPYIVGIDRRGIYISRLHYHKPEVSLPGVHEDEGNRGVLYLQELVEGLPNRKPTVDKEAPKDDPIDLELESEGITLGHGKMGMSPSGKADDKDSFYIELPDPRGGENTIYIPNHKIGEQIEINIPKFHATGGKFPGGSVGDIALDLAISVEDLAKVDFMIVADVRGGTIKDLHFGDATLSLDAETLKGLPAPTAKDMKPKAKGDKQDKGDKP